MEAGERYFNGTTITQTEAFVTIGQKQNGRNT